MREAFKSTIKMPKFLIVVALSVSISVAISLAISAALVLTLTIIGLSYDLAIIISNLFLEYSLYMRWLI